MYSLKEASALAREADVAAAIDAVDRYLLAASGPERFRHAMNAPDGGVDRAAYRGLAGLGLASAMAPEPRGGSGFAPGIAALVGERLGRCLAREPFVENIVLPHTLLERLGAPAPDDTEIACVAWQEGAFGLPAADAIRTIASVEGARVRLRGRKVFVMGARASTRLYVLAAMEGEPAIVSVPSASASRTDQGLADGTCWSEVRFDGAVDGATVLARGAQCVDALTAALDLANLAIAGQLHGLQTRILEMTLDYLATRVQFDKPLAAFQALQHRAVDLYTHAQIARFLVGEAADAFTPGASARTMAAYASRAKARTADTALRIAKEGIQMHGAIGFSDEYELGLYVKRILVLSAWLGGAKWHRRRFATLEPAAEAA